MKGRGLTMRSIKYHTRKEAVRPFLIYVDKVVDFMLSRETDQLRCTQLHFPEMDEAHKAILLEFITIRSFYRSLEKDIAQDDQSDLKTDSITKEQIG